MQNKIKIEIYPVNDDGLPYYKTVVFEVEMDDAGRQISMPLDIFHFNTLAQSLRQLAEMFPE